MAQKDRQDNTFTGGMDKATAVERLPEDRYIDAYNLVPVTENSDAVEFRENPVESGRNFRLSNVDGDEWFLEFPDIPSYRTVELCLTVTDEETWSYEFEVWATLDAQTKLVQVSSAGDGTINQQILQAFEGDSDFYATLECDCIVIGLKDPMAHGTGPNGPYIFGIVKSNVDDTNTVSPIPAQEGLKPVGWQVAGGELVVITTAAETPDEGGAPNYGQLWRMDVQDPNATVTPELKVNAQFNVSWEYRCWVDYTIENECTKRVTFGNESIPPYTVNVGVDGVITDESQTLQLFPSVYFSKIDFVGYGTGSLLQGAYNYSYRYVGEDGRVTAWSPPSHEVNVYENNSDEGDKNEERFLDTRYYGEVSTKSVKIEIPEIDFRYSRIQVAYIYLAPNGEPTQTSVFADIGLADSGGPSGIVSVEHNDLSTSLSPVTLSEITVGSAVYTSAKTGLTVNSRLHLGNVCEPGDVAYSQKIGTGVDDIQVEFIAKSFWEDNVMPFNSVVFGDAQIIGIDNTKAGPVGATEFNTIPSIIGTPINSGTPNPDIDKLGGNLSYPKLGTTDYYMRGYMRREWYRFGIVFFLKNGAKSPVHWIGDIQMPAPYQSSIPDIELSKIVSSSVPTDYVITRSLGIRLTNIDVSSIQDDIVGYSIVRTNRSGYVQGSGLLCWSNPVDTQGGYLDKLMKIYVSPQNDFNAPQSYDFQPCFEAYLFPDTANNGDNVSSGTTSAGQSFSIAKLYGVSQSNPLAPPVGPDLSNYNDHTDIPFWGYTSAGVSEYTGIKRCAYGYNDYSSGGGGVTGLNYQGSITSGFIGNAYAYVVWLKTNFNPFGGTLVDGKVVPASIPIITRYDDGRLNTDQSESSLASSEYYYTGHYQAITKCTDEDLSNLSADVFGGDTLAGLYTRTGQYLSESDDIIASLEQEAEVPYSTLEFDSATLQSESVYAAIVFAGEADNNFHRRYNDDPDNYEIITQKQTFELPEIFLNRQSKIENAAYSALQPKEFFDNCSTCFQATIVGSQPKLLGEKINSFQLFPSENRVDLTNQFGEINALGEFTDADINLLVWQNDLVSVIQVSPRQLTTADGADIGTSSIELYRDPRTVAQYIGTQHQWSVVRGVETYYWVDVSRNELYRWAKGGTIEPLGMTNAMAPYFAKRLKDVATLDSPLLFGGFSVGYDFERQQALFTFLYDAATIPEPLDPAPSQWTLAYSEMLGAFTSFLGFQPQGYIHLPGNRVAGIGEGATTDTDYSNLYLLMQDPLQKNTFSKNRTTKLEGTVDASRLVWVLSKYSGATKQPSALLLDISDLWEYLQVTTNPQRDALGNKIVWRGRIKIDDTPEFWQPRGGKWQGPVPFATDLKVGNSAWQDDAVLQPVQGEQIYFQIAATTADHIDIFSATAQFIINKMNR